MNMNLEKLRNQIEKLNIIQQKEILEILKKNDVPFTENQNGIFINMTDIEIIVIAELERYTNYIYKQNVTLNVIEKKKEKYVNTYFSNS